MPEDDSDEGKIEVPVIPVPSKDSMDDSAEKESAFMSSGHLELTVQGSKRRMKAFTITSTELASLDTGGVLKNTAYATAFSLLSFAIGLATQALFSDFSKLPPLAQAMSKLGIPLALILCAVAFFIAWHISKNVDGIKNIVEGETAHDNS